MVIAPNELRRPGGSVEEDTEATVDEGPATRVLKAAQNHGGRTTDLTVTHVTSEDLMSTDQR